MSGRNESPAAASEGDAPTLVVGVLGGIASGKSQVARSLAALGGRIVDADRIAHAVLNSPEVAQNVAGAFGQDCLDSDGRPDRARLAERVFGDPALRRELESWIHPRVRARIFAEVTEARAQQIPLVVLDVPLLLEARPDAVDPERPNRAHSDAEANARESDTEARRPSADWNSGDDHRRLSPLAALCDVLLFVDAPLEERARRAERERGWASGEVERRERAQVPIAEKRDASDFVIDNRTTPEELGSRAQELGRQLLQDR